MISCSTEFTITQIDFRTYMITDYFHDHMYLLCGKKQAMLIDTGAGSLHLYPCIRRLTDLPFKIYLTHGHVDHIGSADLSPDVYLAPEDHTLFHEHLSPHIRREYLEAKGKIYRGNMDRQDFLDYIDLLAERPISASPKVFPHEMIPLGNRTVRIIPSPGHTKGSVCFYDVENGYLFSGDTVCDQSVLLSFKESTTLDIYQNTLDRLAKLSVKKIFCGHHQGIISPEYIQTYQNLCFDILSGEPGREIIYASPSSSLAKKYWNLDC